MTDHDRSAIPPAHCPDCGGWSEIAIKRRTGGIAYACQRGHTWIVRWPPLTVIDGGRGGHEYNLEKTTVYIAGPMAGVERSGFPYFEAATMALRKFDLTVLSPHEDVSPLDLKRAEEAGIEWRKTEGYRRYLLRDLSMVAKADVLALLPGWEDSAGVTTEVSFARACGIEVITFSELMDLLHGNED